MEKTENKKKINTTEEKSSRNFSKTTKKKPDQISKNIKI